jgi:hypothetical protein
MITSDHSQGDIFLGELTRVDRIGLNRRLIFTLPDPIESNHRVIVAKLVVPADYMATLACMLAGDGIAVAAEDRGSCGVRSAWAGELNADPIAVRALLVVARTAPPKTLIDQGPPAHTGGPLRKCRVGVSPVSTTNSVNIGHSYTRASTRDLPSLC